jgi:acetyl-CoA carboxylase biotin carboxylase subunit
MMGNKVAAIEAMKIAGVPTVPGSDGAVTADIAVSNCQTYWLAYYY